MFDIGTHENDRPTRISGRVDHPATPTIEEMLTGARHGERWAWDGLTEQFRPLVRAVASGYRLERGDVEDVDQTVWLRLVENVQRIRQPQALPKWLLTTAARESLRVLRSRRRTVPVDLLDELAEQPRTEHTDDPEVTVLRRELSDTVRRGLAELPAMQRELLMLLADDRRLSYREISAKLAIPVGSIGPTRARGLARLSATTPIRGYLSRHPLDGHPA